MDQSNKLVIIINGKGGTGKDTVCELAARHYKVRNVSSIDPIKEIARQHGWHGEKDAKARKFLSDLKQAFVDYNDLPNTYVRRQYEEFMAGDEQIMFVHIREGAQIDAFKAQLTTRCVTLLVHSDGRSQGAYGNASDDQAEDYAYDYCYMNNKPLSELETDFMVFFRGILDDQNLTFC